MRVCVYGAGAIGGLIGARLAAGTGNEVSAVARGTTLAALRRHGLRLAGAQGEARIPMRTVEDPAELGIQDLVVLAVKGPALPAVAARIGALIGPDTTVLTAMNGVPWWFFDGAGGACAGMRLESVDPGGAVSRAIPARSAMGCVMHLSAASPEPGLVVPKMGNRLIVGEPGGGASPRLAGVAELLSRGGFDVEVSERIQHDIWYKLWGNMTMNPISVLTGATADRVLDDPLVRGFASAAMREAAEIGARIGCAVTETPDERHAVTRKLGALRTSMLGDAAAGRPLEIDAIIGAVKEIGERVGVATPSIDALLGLIRLYGRVHGLYPAPA
jgi:2-dehydropantoate 2-reductase